MPKQGKKRPIDKLRDSAESIDVRHEDDDSPITGFVTFGDNLLIVKEAGLYQVQLADQIDPERININIPNAQKRLLPYGSKSEFLSRTLLTSDVLFNEEHLVEIDRALLMDVALKHAANLAHMNGLIETYQKDEAAAFESLEKAKAHLKSRRVLALPEVPNIEHTCKSILVQSKHVLQHLFNIAKEFYGTDLKKGFFSELTELVRSKYGEDDNFYQYLRDTEPFREFVRIARNCIEHEKPKQRVVISNMRMLATGKIMPPSFQLIHPNYPADETPVRGFVESIFGNLIVFSETLVLGLVARHIDNTKLQFPIEVMHCPDGYRGNPNVRYAFSIRFKDGLIPLS